MAFYLRSRCNRQVAYTTYVITLLLIVGYEKVRFVDGASSTSSPTVAKTTVPHKTTFYDVNCVSHAYEISVTSFAAIWSLINVAILMCSFAMFLKHVCYKTFTSETSRGY